MMAGRLQRRAGCPSGDVASLTLSFLFLLSAYAFALASSDSCVAVRPGTGESSLFFTSPQVPSPPLSRCQPMGTTACCSASYTAQIDAGTDRVHQLVLSRFSSVPPACATLFDELACVFCSPASGSFMSTTPTNYNLLHVCESYCNRFYTACGSAIVKDTGKTVASTYADGKDFCANDASWYNVWFIDVVSSASGGSCYDPDNGACTLDDIVGEYTTCDPVYKTRNLIYHWKPRNDGTTCTPGAIQLPQSVFGLPCDVACGPGYYLPLGKTECSPCASGTYSVGGGVRFDDWGDESSPWPVKQQISFVTYAQDTTTKQPKGNPWVQHGSYIDSGNNTDLADMESVLELTVTLVRQGVLTFEAKVDAEFGYDGLRLEIDNTKYSLVDLTHQFRRVSYNLTAGVHVVRWVYFKDYSWSVGEDKAFINMINIEGLAYADDHCDVCPAGTFSPRTGTAECIPCTTAGYIPFGDPPTNCAPCPTGMTALPYDSECRTKLNCTAHDYEPRYTECQPPLPGSRDLSYVWSDPHICEDRYLQLPASQTGIPCEPCAPGQQRGANAKCVFCPNGQFSDGSTCQTCPTGTVGIKSQVYSVFPFYGAGGSLTWPSGWTTGCDLCDTDGFRPHYDSIDSGDGEGLFNSWLEIDADFYSVGQVQILATMDCPLFDCSLRIWVDNIIEDMTFSEGDAEFVHNFTIPVSTVGHHRISIDFARWVPLLANHEHNDTKAHIHSITLVGVEPGGARSCISCPAGTVASLDKTSCMPCPAGKVPSNGVCQSCPANSITLEAGSTECIPCGAGTSTGGATGQQYCRNDGCTFTTNLAPNWPVTFDISALATTTDMYTVYGSQDRRSVYHFSMCNRATNSSCYSPSSGSADSFACRQTWFGTFIDSGRLLNFVYDGSDPSEEKLVVQYTHGEICSAKRAVEVPALELDSATSEGRFAREQMVALYREERSMESIDQRVTNGTRRMTNVTLICDPVAGTGTPQSHPNGVEYQTCALNFVWYSIYGCHICTTNDYDWRYTSCEGGMRTKVWYWKYNPKRCWGGVSVLPQSTVETCTTTEILCPDGQLVSGKFDNCTTCPAGNYSVSGGELIQWWTHDTMEQYQFVASCLTSTGEIDTNCDDGWSPEGINVASQGHMAGTSVLWTTRTFMRDGSITFDFTLLTENEEPLQFFIDNVMVQSWNHTTMQGSTTFKKDIPMGHHEFMWKFSPFLKQERVRQAVIHSVTFRGLGNSKPFCNGCPAPLVALGPGASSCTVCPPNSVYKNSAECETCPDNQYALPGDPVCRDRPACEASDFYEVFSECVGGQRRAEWLPTQPRICTGTVAGLQNRTVDCAACPSGQYRQTPQGPCTSCSEGHHYDINSLRCSPAPAGTASVLAQEFFTGNDGTAIVYQPSYGRNELPTGWATGCRGVCGTNGWRFLGDYMDSGPQYKQADVWVSYTTEMKADGYITFIVNASSHYDIGPSVAAEFFIDNVPQPLHDLIAHRYTFRVSAGSHTFLWLHHQDQETLRGDIRTVVSKLKIVGASAGGYVALDCPEGYAGAGGMNPCVMCHAGQYAPTARSPQCMDCPAGQFSALPGSSECTTCGTGTTPNKDKGATECLNPCIYSATINDTASGVLGNYTFDLTPFRQIGPVVVSTPDRMKTFTVSVCDKLKPSQSSCKSSSAFVCEEDADRHESFEAGNLLQFVPHDADPDSHAVGAGFDVEYLFGSSAECPKNRKTVVHFVCQMGATPYLAQYVNTSSRLCEQHLKINTQHACPRCNSFDLIKVTGACETNGERLVKYEPLLPCIGVPEAVRETCSDVEVNEWAIVITAGIMVAVTVTLVTLAVYFWRKKSQSEQKYALLVQETTAPVEMQDFDDDYEPSLKP